MTAETDRCHAVRMLVARILLASSLVCCACSLPQEQPVWACPPVAGAGPRSTSLIYAERGSASASAIVIARLEGEELGRTAARSDGSYVLRLRTNVQETLADKTIALEVYDTPGDGPRHLRARIPAAAPLTLYVHRAMCIGGPAQSVTSTFRPSAPTTPIEEALAIDLRFAGQGSVEPPALDARFTYEVPVRGCSDPWMLFARHEDGTVSGCWDVCAADIVGVTCGGCTKLAWAAGHCDPWVDAGPPDAGPPDAGPPDAGPPDAAPHDAGPGIDASID